MTDPTLSNDMLVRAYMPAGENGERGEQLQTALVSLGGFASWITTTVAQNVASVAQVVLTLSKTVAQLQMDAVTQGKSLAALASAEAADAAAAAIAALKAKLPDPMPVSVSFSGLLALGKQTKTVTGLAAVKKGDRIVPTAAAALPGNLMLGAAFAPADGQVSIEFGVLAAVTLQSVSVPIMLTVLR